MVMAVIQRRGESATASSKPVRRGCGDCEQASEEERASTAAEIQGVGRGLHGGRDPREKGYAMVVVVGLDDGGRREPGGGDLASWWWRLHYPTQDIMS